MTTSYIDETNERRRERNMNTLQRVLARVRPLQVDARVEELPIILKFLPKHPDFDYVVPSHQDFKNNVVILVRLSVERMNALLFGDALIRPTSDFDRFFEEFEKFASKAEESARLILDVHRALKDTSTNL